MKDFSEQVMTVVAQAMEDKKAAKLVVLNLQGVSLIADYFIICHGNSDTQVQAIAQAAKDAASRLGAPVKGIEGMDTGRWVLLDLGDVIVHVFHRDEREYYNLERLWSDAKVVEYA